MNSMHKAGLLAILATVPVAAQAETYLHFGSSLGRLNADGGDIEYAYITGTVQSQFDALDLWVAGDHISISDTDQSLDLSLIRAGFGYSIDAFRLDASINELRAEELDDARVYELGATYNFASGFARVSYLFGEDDNTGLESVYGLQLGYTISPELAVSASIHGTDDKDVGDAGPLVTADLDYETDALDVNLDWATVQADGDRVSYLAASADYQVNQTWSLNADVRRIWADIEEENLGYLMMASVGAEYSFGQGTSLYGAYLNFTDGNDDVQGARLGITHDVNDQVELFVSLDRLEDGGFDANGLSFGLTYTAGAKDKSRETSVGRILTYAKDGLSPVVQVF